MQCDASIKQGNLSTLNINLDLWWGLSVLGFCCLLLFSFFLCKEWCMFQQIENNAENYQREDKIMFDRKRVNLGSNLGHCSRFFFVAVLKSLSFKKWQRNLKHTDYEFFSFLLKNGLVPKINHDWHLTIMLFCHITNNPKLLRKRVNYRIANPLPMHVDATGHDYLFWRWHGFLCELCSSCSLLLIAAVASQLFLVTASHRFGPLGILGLWFKIEWVW